MKKITINSDGGSRGNPGPAACSFVVFGDSGNIIYSAKYLLGTTTNNQAEYWGIIKALEWLLTQNYSGTEIEFLADSLLIINQINGLYKIKDGNLLKQKLHIDALLTQLYSNNLKISFKHILRHLNHTADYLVNQALDQK